MADDIILRINGQIHGGWKRAAVTRTMTTLAGTFQIDVTDRWADDAAARPILPGARCSVSVAGRQVIQGFVDEAMPRYDQTTHQATIRGRDATADLVDCSAVHEPDEWKDQRLDQLVRNIAEPFGVRVGADVPLGEPFKLFKLQPGETAFTAIERLCRMRAVLPISDGQGGLLLTRAGSRRAGAALENGPNGNVLSGEGASSDRDRFSEYRVRGSSQGNDLVFGDELQVEGRATDGAIGRYRPLVILAETQVDQRAADDRARWEATVRAGRARQARYVVQGWTAGGDLWQPNTLVAVRDDWLAIQGDMLITSVRYRRNETGTTTELGVMHPDAFKLIALPEQATEQPLW